MNGTTRITWRQLRVGTLITLALALLAVGVFFIGDTARIFGERYQLTTLMPTAGGLIEGANVKLAGQDVGKVSTIEFVPLEQRSDPSQVLVITLALDRAVRDQIRADSEARVRTQGLLGDKTIDITPGTLDYPVLEQGDTLKASVAIDYEQMVASASVLVDDLSAMLRNLRMLADTLLAGEGTAGRLLMDSTLYFELVGTSRALSGFLRSVNRGEGALAQLVHDEEIYGELRDVIMGLDSLTSSLLNGEGTLSRLISDDSLYRSLASTSARADSMLAALEQGEGTLGQMMTDQQIYEEMLKLVVDIQVIVQELRETPQKYIPPIRVF